jgi:hypothetical protein
VLKNLNYHQLNLLKMKRTKIFYWIFTGLFGFMMLGSAIPDAFSSQMAINGMHNGLGYPLYFVPFIGVAKILGVLAIVIPGYPGIKEWAYAGLVFDLTGATYSIISTGAPAVNWLFMLLPLSLGFCSYVFYHKKLVASLSLNIKPSDKKNDQNKEYTMAAAKIA